MATFLRTSAKHARATALGAKHVVVVGVDGGLRECRCPGLGSS